MLKISAVIVAGSVLAMSAPAFAAGAGGVHSPFGPGNSGAARGLGPSPDAQANCLGDYQSARDKPADPTRPGTGTNVGDGVTDRISTTFLLGGIMGIFGGTLTCADFVN
ncbi:MAG: hypothetical protein GC201_14750 [Alphaproteobacteria bacterium]|nr:hypothetical protein [Alphaproteobacteria bacterium]